LVPLRRAFVRDEGGTHRDEYFFATDPGLTPAAVVGHRRGRRNIETAFQEARAHLGPESARGWCGNTVPRAGPCPSGLYSVVAILFDALPGAKRTGAVSWPGKAAVTFPDAPRAARRWPWAEAVLPQAGGDARSGDLPERVRELPLTAPAPAA
jgi:hypothetical protein